MRTLTKQEMTAIANDILAASEFNYTAYLHFHAYMRQLLIEAQEKALAAAQTEPQKDRLQ